MLAAAGLAAGQAQDAKPWTGELRDGGGHELSGAVVRLQAGTTVTTATTGNDGRFAFAALPAGEYALSVEYHSAVASLAAKLQLPGEGANVVLTLAAEGNLSLVH